MGGFRFRRKQQIEGIVSGQLGDRTGRDQVLDAAIHVEFIVDHLRTEHAGDAERSHDCNRGGIHHTAFHVAQSGYCHAAISQRLGRHVWFQQSHNPGSVEVPAEKRKMDQLFHRRLSNHLRNGCSGHP
ncbi:hypothetical protein C5Q97_18775 [Victivallales bacterium CCUG 44730]|nr:hypothetical protein C5Q97_18775 [Victivallales bacterium CCUG 44730]